MNNGQRTVAGISAVVAVIAVSLSAVFTPAVTAQCDNPDPTPVCDGQAGIQGNFVQECDGLGGSDDITTPANNDGWTGLAFPFQTGGANVDAVRFTLNSNLAGGDIWIVGNTADPNLPPTCGQPDITNVLAVICCGLEGLAPFVQHTVNFGTVATSAVDPTWVVLVGRTGLAGQNANGFFDGTDFPSHQVARDTAQPSTAGQAFANLEGTGNPGDWTDLDTLGLGTPYCIDLLFLGNASDNTDCLSNPALIGVCCLDTPECIIDIGFQCGINGGSYGGDNSTCGILNPFGACTCGPGQGDCLSTHPTPGCELLVCCEVVCISDPLCCDSEWDVACLLAALAIHPTCLSVESATLAPALALNPPGTQHTVTATVIDGVGVPIQGRLVSFVVLSGPNAGDFGNDTTDMNGEATFTYTGDGGNGADDIEASFVDGQGQTQFSNIALKFWDLDCNTNGIADTCDISCAGFGGACSNFPGCGGSADVDGDGIPDECEPDCNGNGVPDDHDIFLGTSLDLDGNGIPDECESVPNFEDPQEFAAAGEPSIEAVGDLDGEGTDDVVTAIPDQDPQVNGVVQVFLNQGTDMFGQWLGFVANDPVTVGREPSGVAVGLFNTDLFLDVAVTNAGDNTVSILYNKGLGNGALFDPVHITVGNRPSAITAADFNMDTFVDLAVTNELDNNVMLLLNDGMGNFPPPSPPGGGGGAGGGFATFPTGGDGVSLVSDDFDGNKRPDMAGTARAAGLVGPTGLVFVLLGQGDGTFDPVAVYDVGMDPVDLANADLQRDGSVDIVTVNKGDGTISVLINQQDGTFLPALTIPVGATPRSIDAVDLNGDGDSDLAIVADDDGIGPSVQVLANRIDLGGGLVFEDPIAFGVNADPNFVVSADLNNDGIFDLVTVNADEGAGTGSVTALLADPIAPVSCPWDCQAVPSGSVDVPDLLALLAAWGGPQTPGTTCDLDGCGVIAVPDLLELLANWGPCP